jgi:hypothetical protein
LARNGDFAVHARWRAPMLLPAIASRAVTQVTTHLAPEASSGATEQTSIA